MPAHKSQPSKKQTPLSKAQTAKKDKKRSQSPDVRDDVPRMTTEVNPFNRETIELGQDLPLYKHPSMAPEQHRRTPQPEVEQTDQTPETARPAPGQLPAQGEIFSKTVTVLAGDVKNEWGKYYRQVQQGQRLKVERWRKPIMALIPPEDLERLELLDYLEGTAVDNMSDEKIREAEALRIKIAQSPIDTIVTTIENAERHLVRLRKQLRSLQFSEKQAQPPRDDTPPDTE